jgi:hypothetical protein
MAQRRVDRWWMILVAFLAAAAMVLLVLLTETDQATSGPPTRPSTTIVHDATQLRHGGRTI